QALLDPEAFRRDPGDVDDQHRPLAQTLYPTDPSGTVKTGRGPAAGRRVSIQEHSGAVRDLDLARHVPHARDRADGLGRPPRSVTTPLLVSMSMGPAGTLSAVMRWYLTFMSSQASLASFLTACFTSSARTTLATVGAATTTAASRATFTVVRMVDSLQRCLICACFDRSTHRKRRGARVERSSRRQRSRRNDVPAGRGATPKLSASVWPRSAKVDRTPRSRPGRTAGPRTGSGTSSRVWTAEASD